MDPCDRVRKAQPNARVMTNIDNPFGERAQKYWDRRYDLFSKWDEGVETDEVGLFSVKPERFALEIGNLLSGHAVLDAFCGIGGSAIGFARCGKRVIAVDIDRDRLSMAKRNAEIYQPGDEVALGSICLGRGDDGEQGYFAVDRGDHYDGHHAFGLNDE